MALTGNSGEGESGRADAGTACLCRQDDAAAAMVAIGNGAEDVFVDESHFRLSLRTCPHCRQVFLHVMAEMIDWEGGNDPVTRVYFPLSAEESATIRTMRPQDDSDLRPLHLTGRYLVEDWPLDGPRTTAWYTGALPLFLHD